MLKVVGLRKRYGEVVALDGVDLTIERGEVLGLLGANGAGKTTLISIIAGLRRPDGGTVYIDGVDAIADVAGARHKLGLAPQELGIYPVLTVRLNLRFFSELARVPKSQIDERVDLTAAALGLTPLLDKRAANLSGGEKRRLHTALAIVHRPPLLLLDEPTVGADVTSRVNLLQLVKQLAHEGSAVCYTTHYLTEIEELDARVAILSRGRILTEGSVTDLASSHDSQSVTFRFAVAAPPAIADHPRARPVGPSAVAIDTDEPSVVLRDLLNSLSAQAIEELVSVEIGRASLESVYLALTGETLPAPPGDPADRPKNAASRARPEVQSAQSEGGADGTA